MHKTNVSSVTMNTDFDTFMSQLKETNATLDFYCNFKKIAKNGSAA